MIILCLKESITMLQMPILMGSVHFPLPVKTSLADIKPFLTHYNTLKTFE